MKFKEKAHMKGKYVIRKYDAKERMRCISVMRGLPMWIVKWLDIVPNAKELKLLTPIYESPVIENLIVSSSGYGRNIVMRQLGNDTTYPIPITLGAIGTGTNAPADSDTGLQTAVLSSIAVVERQVVNDELTITFFMTDTQLADNTYTEWGIFCAARLFSRSLILPTYAKASGQDTTVTHVVTLT